MRSIFALCLLLSACSSSNDILEELPNSSRDISPRSDVSDTKMEEIQSRPVIVGEDGSRSDACSGLGRATRVGVNGVTVLAAPFANARQIGVMVEGERAFVCTRSLDQKWLGVVIPRLASDDGTNVELLQCGVSEPVDRKKPYDGPCVSGWVSSTFIQLVAG